MALKGEIFFFWECGGETRQSLWMKDFHDALQGKRTAELMSHYSRLLLICNKARRFVGPLQLINMLSCFFSPLRFLRLLTLGL
jgi:hypothetical protein